jgi:hypothetical protein
MAAKKLTKEETYVSIQRLERRSTTFYILGTSPLVMNRMPKKAKEELLMPRRAMNKAARAATLKHNPPDEYRDSVYRCRDHSAPTLIHIPSNAIKKAMAQAAIDMEGATKAEVGRLIKILDETVHLFGKPFLYMDVVRLAGFSKVPDIRTRAKFPRWCCKITVQMISNKIREQDVINLLDAAGDIVGIGDGRTEKGTFNNGSWKLVSKDDKEWHEIARSGHRKVQEAAMAKPEAVDADTEEMLSWYHGEIVRREHDRTPQGLVADEPRGRRRRAAGTVSKRNGHAPEART